MKKPAKKMSAAQRLARIESLNAQLQKDNEFLKARFGIDPQMGVSEESITEWNTGRAQDAGAEAMDEMPALGRGVRRALRPLTDPEAMPSPYEGVADRYSAQMTQRLAPALSRAVSPVFPRRRA